jgi:hypothetical protein
VRGVLAQEALDRVEIEQVDVDERQPACHSGEVRARRRRVRHDADDVVASSEQQLAEIRAVLPARAEDERARGAQRRLRTYVHASLNPSERRAVTMSP